MKYKNVFIIGILLCSMFLCIGCVDNPGSSGETQAKEAHLTESNQQRLINATPVPELQVSLERENLKKRLEFLNKANREMYVALLSNDGKVLATYVTYKVSSVNSMLTTPQQIVDDPYGGIDAGGQVVDSPDLDGSYGSNGDGIFFFTTNGAYVEWNGPYIESSQPFTLATPPVIVTSLNATT
jgi:hypothetical protein